jgi:hypothetical protein
LVSRIEKLNKIVDYLNEAGGKMTFKELHGKMILEYGTTKSRLWSYLEALEKARKISVPHTNNVFNREDLEITLIQERRW